MWLRSEYAIMDIDNKLTEAIGWREGTDGLAVSWKRLLEIPNACMQPFVCGFKTKWVSLRYM